MPELPEVETVRRGIKGQCTNQIVSKVIIRYPSLRWPIPSDLNTTLSGQEIKSIERRGKYLLLCFEHGTLLIHLGMSGVLRALSGDTAIKKHDHIDICLKNGICLRLNDPRRFGCVLWTYDPFEQHKLLVNLGPEPLTDNFSAEYLYKRSQKSSSALKIFLMNSKVVVGVGNIYANEVLFKTKLHPQFIAKNLTYKQCENLVKEIKLVLLEAIRQGGTTLKDFKNSKGNPGYFQQELLAYGRKGKPCTVCDTLMTEIRLGQRSTVFCAKCQEL